MADSYFDADYSVDEQLKRVPPAVRTATTTSNETDVKELVEQVKDYGTGKPRRVITRARIHD